MKKIQWFSWCPPTQSQVEDLRLQGWEIVGIEEGQRLGALDLQSDEDMTAVILALNAAVAANGADAVAGWWSARSVPFYAAWNTSRSVAGGKPTFAHKKFVFIGRL